MKEQKVNIHSREFWFKIVEFLQQNWALIEPEHESVTVFFINDASGVFDRMLFSSQKKAEEALRRNGFKEYAMDVESQEFIKPPEPPFFESNHPNGPIYSSGRFWK